MKTMTRKWTKFLIAPLAFAGISILPTLAPCATVSAEADNHAVFMTTWQTTIADFRMDRSKFIGERLSLECPSRPAGRAVAKVFGTRTYSIDSSICYAALHAGAIPAGGGTVTIQINPGTKMYRGSTRYGVTSQSGDRSPLSFVVVHGPSPSADRVRAAHVQSIG